MNSPSRSSLANRIAARIKRGGTDKLWTLRDFADLEASGTATAATLSRLARRGVLRRVRRGVYYRPGKTLFGETRPDPHATLSATLRRLGVPAAATGVDAWRRLGLTTQHGAVPVVATPRRLRLAPVAGHRVRTTVRPATSRADHGECAVLDALRNLRRIPDTTPAAVLDRLTELIADRRIDVPKLLEMARREPPRVRALLGALLEHARPSDPTIGHALATLRHSLNPLTTYRLREVAGHLPTAARWHIR
jgi:Family of unknown function (DUF6088)